MIENAIITYAQQHLLPALNDKLKQIGDKIVSVPHVSTGYHSHDVSSRIPGIPVLEIPPHLYDQYMATRMVQIIATRPSAPAPEEELPASPPQLVRQ